MATLRDWNIQIGPSVGHVTPTQLPVNLPVREWDYSTLSGPRVPRASTTGITATPHGPTGPLPYQVFDQLAGQIGDARRIGRDYLNNRAARRNARQPAEETPALPTTPNTYIGDTNAPTAPLPRRQLPGQGTTPFGSPYGLPSGPDGGVGRLGPGPLGLPYPGVQRTPGGAIPLGGPRNPFGTAITDPRRRAMPGQAPNF